MDSEGFIMILVECFRSEKILVDCFQIPVESVEQIRAVQSTMNVCADTLLHLHVIPSLKIAGFQC